MDAIDFLLTGSMTRLRGRGTGGITLTRHGAHIDADPEDSYVEADIRAPGLDESVTIRRSLATPSALELEDESARSVVAPLLALAQKGQHLLTRRDILAFITSEASTRAELIQDLLDFGPLERVRRALVRVKGDTRQAFESSEGSHANAQGRLVTHAGLPAFDEDGVLRYINQQREILGAPQISQLESSAVRTDVPRPSAEARKVVDPQRLVNAASSIRGLINESEELVQLKQATDESKRRLAEDPGMLRDLEVENLLRLGLKLLQEDGACPLCGAEYAERQLESQFVSRLETVDKATQLTSELTQAAKAFREMANTLLGALEGCVAVLQAVGRTDLAERVQEWHDGTQSAAATYSLPAVDKIHSWSPAPVGALFPDDHDSLLIAIEESAAEAKSPLSPEQGAWDELTQIEEALQALEESERKRQADDLSHHRASELHRLYGEARDRAVQATYDAIRSRFEDLYRELHSHEKHFSALLEPAGAGLDLQVDFHGRGKHPPHALHSEGHQDSMGICLFLALTERLTAGAVEVIMLDDVMMSVDADHRRALAALLATSFPDRQLVITTHDRSWQGQLVTERVVTNRNSYHFTDWTVESGPRLSEVTGLWDRIEADLVADDVPAAAAKLRRGAEDYLAQVCDRLGASVRYRLDGRVELGDLMKGVMHQFRELTKAGKRSTQSWGDQDAHDWLVEFSSVAGQVFERTNAERWAVNESIHYNSWTDFSASDLRPVVEAFADLFELYTCGSCGGLLETSYVGPIERRVDCPCGKVGWTLEERE